MADSLYDLAIAAAKEKKVWYKNERRELWAGQVGGKPAKAHLKRDGGYVGIALTVGAMEFNEMLSILILTPDKGWELLLLSNRKHYEAWVKRAAAWVELQKRERAKPQQAAPALWVSEVGQ